MEINLRFLPTFSLVVAYLQVLEKNGENKYLNFFSSRPKTSHFIIDFKAIVISFKFDLLSLTYVMISSQSILIKRLCQIINKGLTNSFYCFK